VQGLIKALQQNTQGNVLATPQLLTLDNQEAQIEISENIPIPSSTAVQGAGVSTSITREKVALTLKVKPQINKISNFVKLDIDQKLEDIDNRTLPSGVANLAFATTSRSQKTTVVVQDGDTVAMGGLTRDKIEETATKIPLLGDIPLVGWLFRSKATQTQKTNLLVFMTPQIIKQYQHVRKILDKKIRERDEFLEQNAGGEDPYRAKKIDMIKSLPKVEDLRSGGRVENAELEPSEEPDEPRSSRPGAQQPSGQQQFSQPPQGATTAPQTMDGATAPGVNTNPVVPQQTTPLPPASVAPGPTSLPVAPPPVPQNTTPAPYESGPPTGGGGKF
jgi:hypothetical protein